MTGDVSDDRPQPGEQPGAAGPDAETPAAAVPGDGARDEGTETGAEEPGPAPGVEEAPEGGEGFGPDAEAADLRRERDEYLGALQRVQADFENYRKRVAKQQADQIERAAESLVVKLLPVLDTVDLALAHVAGEPGGIDGGAGEPASLAAESGAVAQIAGALNDVLTREGLERIEAQGRDFDPTEHEAVLHEADGDAAHPEVVEVLRAGWRWRGKVLRAAMVKVKG